MSELRDLYQQLILDHGRKPRNFRVIENAQREADGHNPLCGDRIHMFVTMDGETIADVSFQGQGCAISTASASLLTQMVKGMTVAQTKELFGHFRELVTKPVEPHESLEKLAVFSGVREFPMRVKCATLSWHTLLAALKGEDKVATTE